MQPKLLEGTQPSYLVFIFLLKEENVSSIWTSKIFALRYSFSLSLSQLLT